MGGPAAWLGVGDRPTCVPCCLVFPVGRVSDARSSLICAGWLPQDGLFEWNGHHCLRKRTWPAVLVVHRSRVDPVPRAWSRIQPCRKDIVGDLVRGAAPGDDGAVMRRGVAGRSNDLPDGGAAGGRGGCGVKGGRRPSRQRSRQRPLRPEGRPLRLCGAPQRRCCRSWSVHGFRGWLVVHDGQRPGPAGDAGDADSGDGVLFAAGLEGLPA